MSKKTKAPKITAVQHEVRVEANRAIRELDRVRRFVPFILAQGALVERDSDADDVAQDVASQVAKTDELEAVMHAFDGAIRKAGLPTMVDGVELDTAFFQYASRRARASYLLGIAVGHPLTRLAPQAFRNCSETATQPNNISMSIKDAS